MLSKTEYSRRSRERNPGAASAAAKRYHELNPEASRAIQERRLKNKPASVILRRTRGRAKKAGLEFAVSEAWVTERLANGHCEVTDLPFDVRLGTRTVPNPWAPSIDRKDCTKGYTEDNCQLVVWVYNLAKYGWDNDVVLRMARALIEMEKV